MSTARVDLRAAVYAGIVAGTLATLVQIALWRCTGDALPQMLLRDARLTAAIVLGREILPSSGNAVAVMAAATLLHYGLSVIYALLLATLIDARRLRVALALGVGFGLALFAINLYGFTLLFPWFALARDWITLVAHGVFGLSAAACYHALRRTTISNASI